MELKLSTKKLKIIADGLGEFDVARPTIGQLKELNDRIASRSSDAEVFDIYADFLKNLGLPEQLVTSLDMDQFTEVVTFVTSPSKKNQPS